MSFARNSGTEHTCLALWMRVWITDNCVEMGWLDIIVKVPIGVGGFSVDCGFNGVGGGFGWGI